MQPEFRILLVEDDEADIMLLEEACARSAVPCQVEVARDGVEALEVLGRLRSKQSAPHLILLDLNMPRKNGLTLLGDLRADPVLNSLPVVMLTNSTSPRDVQRCYETGGNAYVCKSMNMDRFLSTIETTILYWSRAVQTPRPSTPRD